MHRMTKTTISKIKNEALSQKVPIISADGLLFLKKAIIDNEVKNILEIGSAVGYSASEMALIADHVTTIERDEAMYQKAKENINELGLENKITLIFNDALSDEITFSQQFDMIFIDAAKAQYQKFFNKYKPFLKDNGIIVTDNLNFHNLDYNRASRGTKGLLKRLNEFKLFLENNDEFETKFTDIGDGMSISRRVKKWKKS